jgi:hypothetical protein
MYANVHPKNVTPELLEIAAVVGFAIITCFSTPVPGFHERGVAINVITT